MRRVRSPLLVVALALALAGCASTNAAGDATRPASSGATRPAPLRILVSNDDGIAAAGLDGLVEALRAEPGVELAIVAPATDRSGTGGTRSETPPVVLDARTPSGRVAKAVVGYPADTVIWAVDAKGVPWRPDLVVAGSNVGQNPSPYNLLSGTIGAARTAGARGIPAIAVSQGLNDTTGPDFVHGLAVFMAWFREHRATFTAAPRPGGVAPVWSFNAPSCATGAIRGVVDASPVQIAELGDYTTMDCTSTRTAFRDDLDAWNNGFATVTVVPVEQVLLAA